MNHWSQALLAGCFVMLALLTGLVAYQFVEIRPRQSLSSDTFSQMVAAVEQRLMRDIDQAVRRLDGVQRQQLSSDAIRTIIRASVEETLASTASQPQPVIASEQSSPSADESTVPVQPALERSGSSSSFSVVPASQRADTPFGNLEQSKPVAASGAVQPDAPIIDTASLGQPRAPESDVSQPEKPSLPTLDPSASESAGEPDNAIANNTESSTPGGELLLQQVHFSYDSDALTPGAQRKTKLAADMLMSGNPKKVQILGYADTIGDPLYNADLSLRRATAVADALVAAGIPEDLVEVIGRGENGVPEPTDDEIDEPLNRCVGIFAVN